MQASEPKDLNPYVAVVAKKHRNLKKKLERVAKAEQLLAQGKVLDEEQRILLSSKKAIEKSVTELASIKQMLEEVAKSEEAAPKKTDNEASAPVEVKVESVTAGNDAATVTESAEQFAAATNTEEEEEEYEAPVPEVDLKEKFNEFIERLIKALHVYERYTNVTSHGLPDNVMYFGRTLLGLTSISSFQDTLANSIRVAGFYLHDDLANSNDVIRGTSYAKLAVEIDNLVDEMERAQQRGSTNALTALLRTTIAPASPTSTPSPVESVPTYDSGLYGSLQFGEQPLGTFNQFQYAAPEPVYQAPAAEVRPAVPIAPTLPEFDHEPVIEEPEDEEEGEEEQEEAEEVNEEEHETVHIEEVVEEEVAAAEEVAVEEAEAEEVAPASTTEDAAKARLGKNVRVRGDPSRAVRKAEDAKKVASRGASHHLDTHHGAAVTHTAHHHQEPAQKSFRDRLLSSQAAAAAPVAAPAAAAAAAAAAAVVPVAPVLQEVAAVESTAAAAAEDKRKPRVPRTHKKDETVAATEGETVAAEPVKRDRNTRVRNTRRSSEDTTAADATAQDAGKKWSFVAAASTAETATATTDAVTEKPHHRTSPPKTDRPPRTYGDKPHTAAGAATGAPRREKKVFDHAAAPAPAAVAAPVASADGFQAVSRRSAPSTATSAVKKDGEKKPYVPRGDRPAPAKKPVAAAAPAVASK